MLRQMLNGLPVIPLLLCLCHLEKPAIFSLCQPVCRAGNRWLSAVHQHI